MAIRSVVFHADLSEVRQDVEYFLAARGELHPFAPHTDESRRQARAEDPGLAEIPDRQLTHYTPEPVPMASEVAVRVHVAYRQADGSLPADGPHAGHAFIFTSCEDDAGERLHRHIDWIGTAKTFLAHHADLRAGDPEVACVVAEHMDKDEAVDTYRSIEALAGLMRSKGEPSATPDKGWASLEAVTYHGETRYLHRPRQEILDAARPALNQLMVSTKNDERLRDKKWQQATGVSTVTLPQQLGTVATDGSWTATLDKNFAFHGVETEIEVEPAPAERTVRVKMKNTYVRYLAAYIQFFDAGGHPIAVPDWHPVAGLPGWIELLDQQWQDLQFQTDSFRFLGTIDPIDTVLAVPNPLVPGQLVGQDTGYGVRVQFPENAVSAGVYACGLGLGERLHPGATFYGMILTIICNLVFPSLMMAFDVASNSYRPLYDFIQKMLSKTALVIVAALVYLGKSITSFVLSVVDGHPDWTQVTDLVKKLFGKLFSWLLEYIEEDLKDNGVVDVAEKVAEEIPFAGWIVSAISIASDVAEMAETVVEVLSSPWEIQNAVHVQLVSEVTLSPDPRAGHFPQAGADQTAHYTVKIVHQRGAPSQLHQAAVPADAGDELRFSYANPLGGSVKFEAEYRIDDEVRAKATTGWMSNDPQHVENVRLVLVDKLVHLGPDTSFEHGSLLTYEQEAYRWKATTEKPTAVYDSRADSTGNVFSAWNGIALDQHRHRLAWAFHAAGTGIRDCSHGQTDIQVQAIVAASIPGLAPALRLPSCGFIGTSDVVADVFPPRFQMKDGEWVLDAQGNPVPDPADEDLGTFYVDPRRQHESAEAGGGFHLREVAAGGGPIDVGAPALSYGRFRFTLDSLALHPAGWCIAISQQMRKIQVARVPLEGASDESLPYAQVFSGQGIRFDDTDPRAGLLVMPVGVACAYDGTILILENLLEEETSMARIQAFDLHGNPVSCFGDGQGAHSPFLKLPVADRTYLDLAAVGDAHGCNVFVLYHTGAGQEPSDYKVDVFTYSDKGASSEALLTVDGVAAAALAADMWNTLYTLDYGMTTDGAGHPAGPAATGAGPAGRTVPAVSSWLPKTRGGGT